jgi:CheY-like chemotaxis protein
MATTPHPTRVLRALIVDDYPVNRRLMEMLLADLGHQTVVVHSGMEALRALKENTFDFAFLDLQMPDMDGFQTARAILDAFGNSAPVLVACSGSEAVNDECMKSGFNYVLPKPVTLESLSAVLEGRALKVETESHAAICWEMPEGLAMLAQMAGKDKVAGLLELFLRESERRIDVLLKMLSEKNMEIFCRTAHSLKGSSAQMGAIKLAEISSELEQQSKKGEHIRLTKLVALAKEFEKVQAAVKAYLAAE